MAAPLPIGGITSIIAGSKTIYSCATPNGTWSSTDTDIATVDADSGLVTAISSGSVQIVYTVDTDSTAINLTVQPLLSLTNGINYNTVYPKLKDRVLWKSQGIVSHSQRYYEDFHPLNDTAIIDAMRPQDGSTLAEYLANEQRAVIMEILNATYNAPQIIDRAKLVFYRDNQPLPYQLVQNVAGSFVGLQLFVGKGDNAIKLNSLQMFFTRAADFNLYLYNDFFIEPKLVIPVHVETWNETIIDLGETIILNNLVPSGYKGGRWYLGYWADDIIAQDTQAIFYPVNYNLFHCASCLGFSAPTWQNPPIGGRNFVRNNIGANNLMYGMNLEMSSFVDASNNIVQNNHLFDELMGLMMSVRRCEYAIFNYRSNSDQRNVEGIPELGKLYAELNGFKADEEIPYVLGLKDKVNREMKRVKQAFQKHESITIGTA